MNIIRCNAGHFFDTDRTQDCPLCRRAMLPVEPELPAAEIIPEPEPVEPEPEVLPEEIVEATEAPEEVTEVVPEEIPEEVPEEPAAEPEAQLPEPWDPVMPAGWIICTEGPDRGADFRIHSGYNDIGITQSMQVRFSDGNLPGRERAAVIGFDEQACLFSIAPCGGSRAVRVNGRMILETVDLRPYDEISVGSVKFLFVPLCGEHFRWEKG